MADADWARVLWPLRRAILTSYPSTDDMWSAGKVLGHDDERDGELPAQAVLLGGLLPISGASGANARQPALADLVAIGTGSSVRFGHRVALYGPTGGAALEVESTGAVPATCRGAAASGAAKSGNPVLTGGQDGTNAVTHHVTAAGDTILGASTAEIGKLGAGTAEIGKLAAGAATIGAVRRAAVAGHSLVALGAHAAGGQFIDLVAAAAGHRLTIRTATVRQPTTAVSYVTWYVRSGGTTHAEGAQHALAAVNTPVSVLDGEVIVKPGETFSIYTTACGLDEAATASCTYIDELDGA